MRISLKRKRGKKKKGRKTKSSFFFFAPSNAELHSPRSGFRLRKANTSFGGGYSVFGGEMNFSTFGAGRHPPPIPQLSLRA